MAEHGADAPTADPGVKNQWNRDIPGGVPVNLEIVKAGELRVHSDPEVVKDGRFGVIVNARSPG